MTGRLLSKLLFVWWALTLGGGAVAANVTGGPPTFAFNCTSLTGSDNGAMVNFDRDNTGAGQERYVSQVTDGNGVVLWTFTNQRSLGTSVGLFGGQNQVLNFTTAPTANPITYTLTSLGGNGLPAQVVFSSEGVCSTLPMLSGVHTQTCNVRWQARSVMNDAPGNSLAYFLETVAASRGEPGNMEVQHWTSGTTLNWRNPVATRYPIQNAVVTVTLPPTPSGTTVSDSTPAGAMQAIAASLGWPAYTWGPVVAAPSGTGNVRTVTLGNMPANSGFSFTYNQTMPAGTPINVDREMMLQLSGSYMRGNPGDPNTSPSCVLPVPNPDTFVLGPGSISTDSVLANDTADAGAAATPSNVTLSTVSAPSPAAGSITLDANGFITVAPGTTPGIYDYIYQICVPASGAETAPVCRSVKDSVTVVSLDPEPDAFSVPAIAGGTTSSVVANDQASGVQAVIGTNVTLTPGTPPAPSAGAIVMNPDGTITVAPNTTPGTYDVPYRLCTVPASTPATCLDLTARVTVAAPAQPTAVPTLTAWALILLGTLVGGLGVRYHRLRI